MVARSASLVWAKTGDLCMCTLRSMQPAADVAAFMVDITIIIMTNHGMDETWQTSSLFVRNTRCCDTLYCST